MKVVWKFKFQKYNSGSFFSLKALKSSVPAGVKWSEVKPGAHLWPQFQPEPASGSWKMAEGQKSRVKGGETSALATLTRTTYQPALERRKELQCGNARTRAVQGKVSAESAVHRSQPSRNPHHLPGFESLKSSLLGSVLDPAPGVGSSKSNSNSSAKE